jgi:hypothetical protein
MKNSATIDRVAREAVDREIAQVARTSDQPANLDELRRRLPQANGDQDTW